MVVSRQPWVVSRMPNYFGAERRVPVTTPIKLYIV